MEGLEKVQSVFAHESTIFCFTQHCCIPCMYKLFPNGSEDIGDDLKLPPNIRPELCPRSVPRQDTGDGASHLGLYANTSRILTIGDGDFSFSLSLLNKHRDGSNIVCTSYESYDSVTTTYLQARHTLDTLNNKWGVKTLHGVDAANLSKCAELTGLQFDVIVWNFPCVGVRHAAGLDGQVSEIEENRTLLRKFFLNSKDYLSADGMREVHITHKTIEPFSWWKIEVIAEECGLAYQGAVVFDRLDGVHSYENCGS